MIAQKSLTIYEFKALFLIHGAFSDYLYHEKESELIKALVPLEAYEKMLKLFLKNREASFSLLIREFKLHCAVEKTKEESLKYLRQVLNADGVFNDFEKYFDQFFNEF